MSINYYGIAASFYGNKLNVCTLKKKPGSEEIIKADESHLSWKETDNLPEAVNKLLETVVEVAHLQYKENEKAGEQNYIVPVVLGWPGKEKCPPQLVEMLDKKFQPQLNGKVVYEYSGQTTEDLAISNIIQTIGFNHLYAQCSQASIAISQAQYDSGKSEYKPDYEKYLGEAYNLAIKPATRDEGIKLLCQYAKTIAKEEAEEAREVYGPILSKQISFKNFRESYYNYLDFPEVREVLQRTLEELLGSELPMIIKLPKDPRDEEFTDIARSMMIQFMKLAQAG